MVCVQNAWYICKIPAFPKLRIDRLARFRSAWKTLPFLAVFLPPTAPIRFWSGGRGEVARSNHFPPLKWGSGTRGCLQFCNKTWFPYYVFYFLFICIFKNIYKYIISDVECFVTNNIAGRHWNLSADIIT